MLSVSKEGVGMSVCCNGWMKGKTGHLLEERKGEHSRIWLLEIACLKRVCNNLARMIQECLGR